MEEGEFNSWWNSRHGIRWEKWYAWHPVKVHGRYTWLKTVYRRYNWAKSTEQPFGREYDYGTIFDVLTEEQYQVGGNSTPEPPFKGLQDG